MYNSGFHPFKGRVSRHFGDSLSPDDAYLSYYDVRLTREDVDTLKDDWLTDNCIAFWEEYLEREELARYPNSHIVLLRPSMAFMLMQTPDPMTLKEALPDFTKTTHVFLPINDCRNVEEAEGGSHWSLLLVSILDGVSFHYDSLFPSNSEEAHLVSINIGKLCGHPLKFMDLDDSPQQENSSDCGIFVCTLMRELLLKKLLRINSKEKISMSMKGKGINAHRERKDMLKIIESYRREGERRRSRSSSPFAKHEQSKSPPRIS